MGPHCLPLRLLKHFSRREKQTTFVAIGALKVKDNETENKLHVTHTLTSGVGFKGQILNIVHLSIFF